MIFLFWLYNIIVYLSITLGSKQSIWTPGKENMIKEETY